jgi:hypothetical protein
MTQPLNSSTASQPDAEPREATNLKRVRASLASGGCATPHFRSDTEFRAARAAVREHATRTRFGSDTVTSWRA